MLEFWSSGALSRSLAKIIHIEMKNEFKICHALSLLVVLPLDLLFPHHRFISLAETFNMAAVICGSFSTSALLDESRTEANALL